MAVKTISLRVLPFFGAALLCPALSAQDSAQPPLRLSGAEATVEDSAGAAQFAVGPGDPAFARMGNPGPRILDRDSATDRVRVSAFGREALWISCRFVADTPGYCDSAVRAQREAELAAVRRAMIEEEQAQSQASLRGDRAEAEARARAEAEMQARGIPVCPGDPRCP